MKSCTANLLRELQRPLALNKSRNEDKPGVASSVHDSLDTPMTKGPEENHEHVVCFGGILSDVFSDSA